MPPGTLLHQNTRSLPQSPRCHPPEICHHPTTIITKIDYLGIAVKSLEESILYYQNTLGLMLEGREEVESQKVHTAFFGAGDVHIELLEPTSDEGPIAKLLEKNGPGIHHITFATDDITGQLAYAQASGTRLIHEVPFEGAAGKLVDSLHPQSTFGVLTEFCQPVH